MTSRPTGNLPVELTSFVGRRDDLTRARKLLGTTRLLTLTGVGGVGKSRLGVAVAASVRRDFPDGVWVVELADLRHSGLLTQTICGMFGLRTDSADAFGLLAEHLRTKRLLLVLDNCEHLIDACSGLVRRILSAAPSVKILATSRHVLGVEGAQLFPVSPLTVESSGGLGEAMLLFEERASAAQPDFRITNDNRAAIEDICRQLEGLPLAIELAAANIRIFGPAEIAARLGDSTLLTSAEPGRTPRHRTVESIADWSYQLCSERERQVWEQLSVFVGGFTAETADGVCLPSGSGSGVLRELIGLLDKSMIVRVDDHATRERYRLLGPMRQYALDKLESSGDAPAIRVRHRDYFLRLAERSYTDYCSPDDIEWFRSTRAEHANLREALSFSLSETAEAATAAAMVRALRPYWSQSGTLLEGFQWTCRTIEEVVEPAEPRAEALVVGSVLGFLVGEVELAESYLHEHHDLTESLGIGRFAGIACFAAALGASLRHDNVRAFELAERAVEPGGGRADDGVVADCMPLSALYALILEDDEAEQYAIRGLEFADRHGAHLVKALALGPLGILRWHQGDIVAAESFMLTAIELYEAFDYPGMVAVCIEVIGCCAAEDEPERAATLLGAARTVWHRHSQMKLAQAALSTVTSTIENRLRGVLGDETFESAVARGRALPLDDAVRLARRAGAAPVTRSTASSRSVLTRRENQVAALVAEGLTNREIATKLTISPRTVDAHVDHILTKLGFRSRTQIARWVSAGVDG
ncbi:MULTISPECIES: ATP-binding protein [Gordonia]|uniref:Putative LuxR family transcriptional regulator n=1 Tax=Gordonia alkanivorans NBRC 16433 TaxID=1027371 RepID=F9VPN4_9ACTN|nr:MULTISPECIES: LuxR C-terminal-related transcriptional regulator [Gordonia]MDH3008416.1 LuxR C-terminal-related transcriptional regulator [Gordonia alkanivorans]MDH3015654.1 LuxR C-terminal-related transcriptional regulator [Gordonia alkanivorans]MDH3020388.1 LuxR C-terminal-related transcriptional regulator [Gordonia alkanivorans]MDH3026670.1 LuxR C-terminal-related transcriptional regulator [Gordonia alkanivorans]MDH3040198.1 LuxR C-terminal-related transcriptional regulator [Gordonia alka